MRVSIGMAAEPVPPAPADETMDDILLARTLDSDSQQVVKGSPVSPDRIDPLIDAKIAAIDDTLANMIETSSADIHSKIGGVSSFHVMVHRVRDAEQQVSFLANRQNDDFMDLKKEIDGRRAIYKEAVQSVEAKARDAVQTLDAAFSEQNNNDDKPNLIVSPVAPTPNLGGGGPPPWGTLVVTAHGHDTWRMVVLFNGRLPNSIMVALMSMAGTVVALVMATTSLSPLMLMPVETLASALTSSIGCLGPNQQHLLFSSTDAPSNTTPEKI